MDLDSAKMQYFRQQLEKGVKEIFSSQAAIASERIRQSPSMSKARQGEPTPGERLMEALNNPRYRIEDFAGGVMLTATVPVRLRILDMKRYANWKIYNRQVWGILYRETRQNIKYEFRDFLQKNFPELLEQFNRQK